MHVRFSSVLGHPVSESETGDIVGMLSDILIDPDTGKIEGFFVDSGGLMASQPLFLSVLDIVHWGTRIVVRERDVLCPLDDLVRLQSLLDDERSFLGQTMMMESGSVIGVCKDVQFDTKRMKVEWLFPKKWMRWGVALPVSEIVEVKKEAIIMRDPVAPATEPMEEQSSVDPLEVLQSLPEVQEPASRVGE